MALFKPSTFWSPRLDFMLDFRLRPMMSRAAHSLIAGLPSSHATDR
jgi:hypothetical protein